LCGWRPRPLSPSLTRIKYLQAREPQVHALSLKRFSRKLRTARQTANGPQLNAPRAFSETGATAPGAGRSRCVRGNEAASRGGGGTAIRARPLISKPQQERRMTSQDPTDPPRTSTDSPRRAEWGLGVTDPPPRATDSGLRAAWGIGAIFVVVLIVAAIALWNHGSATSSTATGPGTTHSAPSSTGQGGAANTGPAR